MNHIKPAFLLCVFCASTFVMSNCTQHQPIRGCSNGPLDERNFFIPLATHNCGSYLRWCCPAGKLQVSQVPYQNCLLDHKLRTKSHRQKRLVARKKSNPAVALHPKFQTMEPSTIGEGRDGVILNGLILTGAKLFATSFLLSSFSTLNCERRSRNA
ncbi:hypothetical protein MJO29_000910 [Puccinia striiformis f. sp. tritici]|nr:hypothetical protein MJO29_000910 [Puccinia striiformis f. sp. tritici]